MIPGLSFPGFNLFDGVFDLFRVESDVYLFLKCQLFGLVVAEFLVVKFMQSLCDGFMGRLDWVVRWVDYLVDEGVFFA